MSDAQIVGAAGGVAFEDAPDHGRVLVSGADTDGAYSLMELTVVSRAVTADHTDRDFGPHRHADIEELFVVREGTLDFLVGDRVTTVHAHAVVRVPAGTRHGYLNRSGRDVELLVMFMPGGFEELFVRHRTDQPAVRGGGFVADALEFFGTNFEA
jgi:mannose-6-phosphate isomerase-like protein (cupin superfamily)